jgi:hypothetical protein
VWLGNRTLSPKPAATSIPHCRSFSKLDWGLRKR